MGFLLQKKLFFLEKVKISDFVGFYVLFGLKYLFKETYSELWFGFRCAQMRMYLCFWLLKIA